MATADSSPDINTPSARTGAPVLVLLSAMPPEQLENVVANLTASFPPEDMLIATPDGLTTDAHPALRIIPITASNFSLTLTAADFVNAYQLAVKNESRAVLMLGPGSGSLRSSALRELASAILAGSNDLAIPRYSLPMHAGLVNSAILYPLTRALFASRARFPLAIDLCLSLRMAERLATAAQRFTTPNQSDAILWPINEAAVGGFMINEFEVGTREIPQPAELDINSILASVTGSLFADIDAKAAFWQRAPLAACAQSFPDSAIGRWGD